MWWDGMWLNIFRTLNLGCWKSSAVLVSSFLCRYSRVMGWKVKASIDIFMSYFQNLGTSGQCSSGSAFGQPTGDDIIGHYNRHSFPFFSLSWPFLKEGVVAPAARLVLIFRNTIQDDLAFLYFHRRFSTVIKIGWVLLSFNLDQGEQLSLRNKQTPCMCYNDY